MAIAMLVSAYLAKLYSRRVIIETAGELPAASASSMLLASGGNVVRSGLVRAIPDGYV